jgi:hypothetical protein
MAATAAATLAAPALVTTAEATRQAAVVTCPVATTTKWKKVKRIGLMFCQSDFFS